MPLLLKRCSNTFWQTLSKQRPRRKCHTQQLAIHTITERLGIREFSNDFRATAESISCSVEILSCSLTDSTNERGIVCSSRVNTTDLRNDKVRDKVLSR